MASSFSSKITTLIPYPLSNLWRQRPHERFCHRHIPRFLVEINLILVVQMIERRTGPLGQDGSPRQSQHTLHPPMRHQQLRILYPQRREFGITGPVIEQLTGGIQKFAQPRDGHIWIGAIKFTVLSVDRRIEATGYVIPLVGRHFPIVEDDSKDVTNVHILVLGHEARLDATAEGQIEGLVPNDDEACHHVQSLQHIRGSSPEEGAFDVARVLVHSLQSIDSPCFEGCGCRKGEDALLLR